MKLPISLFFLFLTLSANVHVSAQESTQPSAEHNQWLKSLFSKQHETLIPKVSVADMFYGCNLENNGEFGSKTLAELINQTDKERLAEKLVACLNGIEINSDKAINYGLLGCFHDQLQDLPKDEQNKKIKLVKSAISSLSLAEKKKSLSQCVTDQAISYLK